MAGPPAQVWFYTACDDQPPWKADERKPCPTCKRTDHVEAARRIPSMEHLGDKDTGDGGYGR